MQHLDEGTIHAWLDGALSADEAAGVEQHARACTECAALVADARGMIAGVARIVSALDDVPGGVVPKRRAASERRSMWRTLRLTPLRAGLAASFLVAAAGLEVIRHAPRDATTTRTELAPAASAPLAVDGNAPLPAAKPTSEKSTMKALSRARATVATPAMAAPPVLAESKSSTPKSVESRLDSVARDTSRRARDVVANSPAADSINRAAVNVDASRQLQQVVVTSATATGRAGNAAAASDIVRARPVDPQLRATAASRTIAQPFRMMLTSADNRPFVFPGCYQLVRDTTSLARLPERFSLESDTAASALRNIVRVLTADGRRDSVMAGVTWQVAPGFSAGVLIVSDGPVVPTTFSRREAAPSLRTEMPRASNGQVNRIDCR